MPHRRAPHPSAIRLTPLRIATQILVLQSGYYAIATALILFTSLSAGKRFSLSLVFSWHSLRGDTTVGWTLGLCWLMSGVFGYGFARILHNATPSGPAHLFIRILSNTIWGRSADIPDTESSCSCSSYPAQNSFSTLHLPCTSSISYSRRYTPDPYPGISFGGFSNSQAQGL